MAKLVHLLCKIKQISAYLKFNESKSFRKFYCSSVQQQKTYLIFCGKPASFLKNIAYKNTYRKIYIYVKYSIMCFRTFLYVTIFKNNTIPDINLKDTADYGIAEMRENQGCDTAITDTS